jgi:hypothetical protein
MFLQISPGCQPAAQAVQDPERKDYHVHDGNNYKFDQHADKIAEPLHKITFPDRYEAFPVEMYRYVRYLYFHQIYLFYNKAIDVPHLYMYFQLQFF